jgi:signal transduction histidine kinase
MKLWLKISLICTAVLLLTVGACSALLLLTSRQQALSLAIGSATGQQSDLHESFSKMTGLYGNESLGPIEKQSLVKYCFKSYTKGPSALISGDETLYSDIDFDPEAFLPQASLDSQKYYIGNVNGKDVIIVADKADITSISAQYAIYTVRDITDVYDNISGMIWKFGVISMVCIMIGVVLIILLISYATKPVVELGESVKRIARGEYTERARVDSEDEIGELAQDFNSMAQAVQNHVEELKEVSQRQQLFIGGLTHEFKTPLTSVIGHAETLLYTKMPEDVVEQSLLYIHEQCLWLERLTQKLLKLVTLQEEMQLQEEPVGKLLEAVGESVAETLSKRGVLLETECEADTLPMDYDLMLSLLINLVDNASKACAAGQTVRIRAHGRVIEVEDSGMGIPAEELSRVTEPFYRVDKSRSKKMGGVGLGLALVKKIAEAHGAKIEIESASGLGTTVRIIFPDYKTFTIS